MQDLTFKLFCLAKNFKVGCFEKIWPKAASKPNFAFYQAESGQEGPGAVI